MYFSPKCIKHGGLASRGTHINESAKMHAIICQSSDVSIRMFACSHRRNDARGGEGERERERERELSMKECGVVQANISVEES